MKRTTQEIADEMGVPKPQAEGLVRCLLALGLARFCGERPSPSGRGKGAHVYAIVRGAGQKVGFAVAKLEE